MRRTISQQLFLKSKIFLLRNQKLRLISSQAVNFWTVCHSSILFLVIHVQGSENVCWAYAISTMLRASIRSAIEKYDIKDGLEFLDNPNHHKMMRRELTMNIFPFGNDGTDPSMVIKLVWVVLNFNFLKTLKWEKLRYFLASNTFLFTRCWDLPASYSDFDFEKLRLRNAAFC